jgi:putative holliday junction resolvase
MARILAIDYGLKRCGIAITDPLKIIATALETVETFNLLNYLKTYINQEEVELILLGLPVDLRSQDTDITDNVRKFAEVLKKEIPTIKINFVDERFTSKMASQALFSSGLKKKDRQQKGHLDKISAVILLQSYLAL